MKKEFRLIAQKACADAMAVRCEMREYVDGLELIIEELQASLEMACDELRKKGEMADE